MINVINGTVLGFNHPDEIYIGRSYKKTMKESPLHNPFSVKEYGRDKALELYTYYLFNEYRKQSGPVYEELLRLSKLYKEKQTLTLVCWCKPKPCHGDVIKKVLQFVNE